MSITFSNGSVDSCPWFVGKMERVQAEQFLMEVSSITHVYMDNVYIIHVSSLELYNRYIFEDG